MKGISIKENVTFLETHLFLCMLPIKILKYFIINIGGEMYGMHLTIEKM